MNYLADTHAIYWYFSGSKRLSRRAKEVLDGGASGVNKVFVPVIVLAELQFVLEKHKSQRSLKDFTALLDAIPGFAVLAMRRGHVEKLEDLRELPDMHDRLIVAHALEKGAEVITCDKLIAESKLVSVVW